MDEPMTENSDRFIVDVRGWNRMRSEALAFLEKGDVEGVEETAAVFIENSCRDREEAEGEKRRRATTLAFVFRPAFARAPLEEQTRLIREACTKEAKYRSLESRWWAKLESLKICERLLEAAGKCDERMVKLGLDAFNERTFVRRAQEKIGEDQISGRSVRRK